MAFIMGRLNLADRLGAPPSRDSESPKDLKLLLFIRLGDRIMIVDVLNGRVVARLVMVEAVVVSYGLVC